MLPCLCFTRKAVPFWLRRVVCECVGAARLCIKLIICKLAEITAKQISLWPVLSEVEACLVLKVMLDILALELLESTALGKGILSLRNLLNA